jgi:hypothetical protein
MDSAQHSKYKECPQCGLTVDTTTLECPRCQWRWDTTIRCYNCMHTFQQGATLDIRDGVLYCPFCNLPLEGQDKKGFLYQNLRTILIAIGLAVALCVIYIYVTWGGL